MLPSGTRVRSWQGIVGTITEVRSDAGLKPYVVTTDAGRLCYFHASQVNPTEEPLDTDTPTLYNVEVCTDCYHASHGFDVDDCTPPNHDPLHLLPDDTETTDNTCSNHDGTDEDPCTWCGSTGYETGITDFSGSACDGCGSHLGGSRYRLAVHPA